MISIQKALEIVHQQKVASGSQHLETEIAVGSYLADDIFAPFNVPRFDNSAMDGYAVSGNYNAYKIVGEIAAGNTGEFTLKEKEAIRIFTGGKVPLGTTAVIIQEKTRVDGVYVFPTSEMIEGQNIRLSGAELKKGEKVFSRGQLLTPAGIGLLMSLGFDSISVYRKPAIQIITTGNELVNPGEKLKPGKIYESNSYTLQSALNSFGFGKIKRTQVRDDFEATKHTFSMALENADVLLVSGGISVGDYDYVYKALMENGVEELFYKVKQKPGKPLFFGRKGNTFVFGLPGNPASSLSCFYIYVLPFLRKFTGANETDLTRIHLPLANDFHFKSDRPAFLKSKIENGEVRILDGQMSSMLHSFSIANALTFIDVSGNYLKGELVDCILIH